MKGLLKSLIFAAVSMTVSYFIFHEKFQTHSQVSEVQSVVDKLVQAMPHSQKISEAISHMNSEAPRNYTEIDVYASLGLRQGDRLYRINGKRADGQYAMNEMLSSFRDGKPLCVTYARGVNVRQVCRVVDDENETVRDSAESNGPGQEPPMMMVRPLHPKKDDAADGKTDMSQIEKMNPVDAMKLVRRHQGDYAKDLEKVDSN